MNNKEAFRELDKARKSVQKAIDKALDVKELAKDAMKAIDAAESGLIAALKNAGKAKATDD